MSDTEPTTEAPEEQAEAAPELPIGDEIITLNVANDTLQILSTSQRRIGLRLLPYNTVAVHRKYGALLFERVDKVA